MKIHKNHLITISDHLKTISDRWDGLRWSEMVMRWLWDGFGVFLCFLVQLGCNTHCLVLLDTFVANAVPPEMKVAALETVEMVLRWFEMVWDGFEMVLRWFWCIFMFLRSFGGAKHIVWCLCGYRGTTWDESNSSWDRCRALRWFWDGYEMVMRWLWDGFGVSSRFCDPLGCKTHCLISMSTFVACKKSQVPPGRKLRWVETAWDGLRWFWDGLRWFWDGFEMVFADFESIFLFFRSTWM